MKAYLAKSNRCNPTDYSVARQVIKNSGAELVEHNGGSYSNDNLLSSDIVIVLPEISTSPVNLGRGLYEQMISALDHNIPVWVIVENAVLLPRVARVSQSDLRLLGNNDYINWARLTLVPLNTSSLSGLLPEKIEIIL